MVGRTRTKAPDEKSAGSTNRRSFADVVLWSVIISCTIYLAWPMVDRGRTWGIAYFGQKRLRAEYKATAAGEPQSASNQRNSRWPYTRLVIPGIGVDAMVVQGVDERSLLYGPGHDPLTSGPGQANCVIAGHRNMAGWWFNQLDTLRPKDRITLETMGKSYTYRVEKVRTVSTADTHILLPQPKQRLLTLYTCTVPKTPQRIVVTATLDQKPN